MAIRLLLLFYFILTFNSTSAQSKWQTSNLPKLQDSLLTEYHWITQQMWAIYHRESDSNKRSSILDIDPKIKKRYKAYGDFLFLLDSLGRIDEIKLVNIEITKGGSLRFYDWKIFIKTPNQTTYNIHTDIGIGLDELEGYDMYDDTRNIIRAMLKELKTKAIFYGTTEQRKNRIIWCSFST